jgi:hypothetical protein
MERCVSFHGHIYRKRRKEFETFLKHKNPRVRATAEEWLAIDTREREEWRRMREEEELLEEAVLLEDEIASVNELFAEAAEVAEAVEVDTRLRGTDIPC